MTIIYHSLLWNILITEVKQSGSSNKYYKVVIGNREWMRRHFYVISEDIESDMQDYEERGQTAVLLAIDGKYRVYQKSHPFWILNIS